MAAARCRQRRVDLTNQLLAETESLEDEKSHLEREVESLQRQKNQLEYVLDAHMPRCRSMPNSIYPPLPPSHGNIPTIKVEKTDDGGRSASSTLRPNSLSISSSGSNSMKTPAGPFYGLDLGSMLDGHTGLTPITGIPSSSSSIHPSLSNTNAISPTTLLNL